MASSMGPITIRIIRIGRRVEDEMAVVGLSVQLDSAVRPVQLLERPRRHVLIQSSKEAAARSQTVRDPGVEPRWRGTGARRGGGGIVLHSSRHKEMLIC